jgi:hypothetical protein
LCFGSRYLGGNSARLLEILPGASFSRIDDRRKFWLAWMIDICADHSDSRQAVFVEDSKGRLTTFFLDHGHLFGGPHGQDRLNFRASRYLDGRIYPDLAPKDVLDLLKVARSLDKDRLWNQITRLPHEWKTASALENFARCLCTLSDAAQLKHILEAAVDTLRRKGETNVGNTQYPKPPLSALYPAILGTALPQRLFAS